MQTSHDEHPHADRSTTLIVDAEEQAAEGALRAAEETAYFTVADAGEGSAEEQAGEKEEVPAANEAEQAAGGNESALEAAAESVFGEDVGARQSLEEMREAARAVRGEAEAVAAEKIGKLEEEVRADLETVLSQDLGELDEAGLRRRVVQLTLIGIGSRQRP